HQIPAEQLPHDTESAKVIRLQSTLLSKFHHRPIFLRAGVLLPRDYERETSKRYPLWINIGGLNTRYTRPKGLMSAFRKTWGGDDTPRFIMIQLDGAGPVGDPYMVNSEHDGHYGDALV